MIKKQNNRFTQELYVAPECTALDLTIESAIAVSGNIDSGNVTTWDMDVNDLGSIEQLLPGIDNNLLF